MAQPGLQYVLGGRSISLLGDQISLLALTLTAALLLGPTPAQMGLLTATAFFPVPFLGLLAGAWVERRPRRLLLISMDLARAVVLASVPAFWLLGALRIELLYAASFLSGCCTAVFDMAKLAYTLSVVERERLLGANSRLELSHAVARVAGPGLAGMLVQLLTGPIAIVLDLLSYVLSAVLIARIRVTEARSALERRASLFAEASTGLKAVAANPLLRGLALTAASMNLFHGVIGSQIVLFLTGDLQLTPAVPRCCLRNRRVWCYFRRCGRLAAHAAKRAGQNASAGIHAACTWRWTTPVGCRTSSHPWAADDDQQLRHLHGME